MEIALLNEEKTIKQLVEVDINESILEQIKIDLSKDEFNFIVTVENVKFAKEKMADLNKSIDFVKLFRRNKVNSESVAIDIFKENAKAYVKLIDDKRESIKKDVEVFEKETKASILKELSLYSTEVIKDQGIRDNFIDVDIVDLIVLGSVTAKGALTKKAKETIDGRVMVCKSKQDKYDMRLMQLENESHRAGLDAPLTITHVQGIIYLENDTEYEEALKGLISTEIERQNTIKANIQKQADEKAQREANQKVLQEQNRIRDFYNYDTDGLILADIDRHIAELSLTNFSQFEEFSEFARGVVNEQVAKLNTHRDKLLEIANNALREMEAKQVAPTPSNNVEVVYETIPKDTPKVEDDKKVVYIDVKLQFKVKKTVSELKIIDKVNQMLGDAGFGESLLSVDVV